MADSPWQNLSGQNVLKGGNRERVFQETPVICNTQHCISSPGSRKPGPPPAARTTRGTCRQVSGAHPWIQEARPGTA